MNNEELERKEAYDRFVKEFSTFVNENKDVSLKEALDIIKAELGIVEDVRNKRKSAVIDTLLVKKDNEELKFGDDESKEVKKDIPSEDIKFGDEDGSKPNRGSGFKFGGF